MHDARMQLYRTLGRMHNAASTQHLQPAGAKAYLQEGAALLRPRPHALQQGTAMISSGITKNNTATPSKKHWEP